MIHKGKQRDYEAHAIIGGNGQGKSGLIAELVDGTYDKRCKKVIILNNTNPPAFQKYFFTDNKEALKRRWNGVIRYHSNEGFEQSIADVYELAQSKFFKNGALVCDDCTKYIHEKTPKHIRNFLVDRRMFELDLFFTTHGLRYFPKFCRGMVNTVTVFKTAESYEKPNDMKGLEYPNYHELFKAWSDIMDTPKVESFIQPHLTVPTGI